MRWIAVLLVLSGCHEVVAPKHCEWITQKGLHADTTVMDCRK